MKTIVFDLEIQKLIARDLTSAGDEDRQLVAEGKAVHGWKMAHTAGISSGVAYCVEEERYHIFGDTLEEHRRLADLLSAADRVAGFNHWKFDYPLLANAAQVPLAQLTDLDAAPGDRDIDLLQMIWAGLGAQEFRKGHGLDAVSLATLGKAIGGKIGDGAQAPSLYQAGRFGPLLNYNLRDVELTARLLRFVQAHGYVITGYGRVLQVHHPDKWFTN